MTQPRPLIDALQSYLSVTLNREKTISMNIANVDTPGYHTRDIDFQGELTRAMQTTPAALEGDQDTLNLAPVAHEVPGLIKIDREVNSYSPASNIDARRRDARADLASSERSDASSTRSIIS